MPPRQYELLHPDARLSDEEVQRLVAALEAMDEQADGGEDHSGPDGGDGE